MATTTFLFTDIEGSTRLWDSKPEAMREALPAHDKLIEGSVAANGGRVFKHMGDGMAAAFDSAPPALAAASEIQRGIQSVMAEELKVRMGIHSGEADERDGDYFGPTLNRVARLMSAGHGGQVLVSLVAARLAEGGGFDLIELGEYRLRDLGRPETIFLLAVPGEQIDFPPLRTLDDRLNNLPIIGTSFIGRETELEELTAALDGARLVTVTGVGGSGKTRLALQTAANAAREYPDGVWLVSLGAVTDPDQVDRTLMDTIGLEQPADATPRQVVIDHLLDQSTLLVLDNCEHVIGAAADLVAEIVASSSETTVLATSRELLGVPGEAAYGLRSMRLPPREVDPADLVDYDAVALFVERAAAADPGFQLSAESAAAVVEICRRLDGMPLAIELAAARLRSFSPAKIADLLDQRFRLLTGGSRTALPRQQTLAATIEWSFRLLNQREQTLFQRLSVFSGGFTFDAVVAVCTDNDIGEFDVLELLPALVDKSLVVTDEEADDRFWLLETLRQFARERLDESGDGDRVRRRHADYFRELIAEAEPHRVGPDERAWKDRILVEFDNLRQAMTWALDAGEGVIALDLAEGFSVFSMIAERWSDALSWFERALEAAGDARTPEEDAQRLTTHGYLLFWSTDHARSVDLLKRAIEIHRDLESESADPDLLTWFSRTVLMLAVVEYYDGRAGPRNEHFTELVEEALQLARRADNSVLIARCLGNLAHHRDLRGDVELAKRRFAEAEEASLATGSDSLMARVLWQRASFEFYAGDLEESRRVWQRAIEYDERSGLEVSALIDAVGLALCEVEIGDPGAADRMVDAIRSLLAFPDVRLGGASVTYHTLLVSRAGGDSAGGRFERVGIAAGALESEHLKTAPVPGERVPYFERTVTTAREALGDDAFIAAKAKGRSMSRDEIAEFLMAD